MLAFGCNNSIHSQRHTGPAGFGHKAFADHLGKDGVELPVVDAGCYLDGAQGVPRVHFRQPDNKNITGISR